MAEDMTPRSALQAVLSRGRHGAASPDAPGVRLRELRGPATWIVTASDAAARPAPGPGTTVIPLAPCRWLVIGGAPTGEAVLMTGAWTRLAVSGHRAADLLAKGCAVDLGPDAFAPGATAQTRFAGLSVILRRSDDADGYEILVARSHAAWLCAWLMEASLEFGCEVG